MSETSSPGWTEPPASPEEVLLAEFLDEALMRMGRGEMVSARQLLGPEQGLVEQGERLLEGLGAVLGAAAGVCEQQAQFQSDLVSLSCDEGRDAPEATTGPETEPLPDPFPGEFRVRRRLGKGAFGTVWLADDLHLGRPVALKTVLPPGRKPAADRLARLREEAQLLAAVEHRNVVRVYAWREAAGSHYLVLQYVPGGSLADRVAREGPLAWQQAARYIADVGDGLLEVHDRGIIHRDVKPANILWDPARDEALLTDFGISARLAEAGTAAGTPFYMPPEAFEGGAGPTQDVFGLAASLFWLVTGSVPFPGPTRQQVAAQARRGLPTPDVRCAGLPAALERLVRAGLAADPAARPSLRAFVTALRGALNRLLADSMPAAPGGGRTDSGPVRLTVSRRVDRHTFLPVATTQPTHEHSFRDVRRVPEEPERADVCTGDRLRIEVESDREGYVTVFNVGPTGNLNLLHPATPEGLARPAATAAGRPLRVLEIELTPPAGPERLFALWTREPLPLRPGELLSLAGGGGLPASGPYRSTRDMALVQESVRQLPPDEWHAVVLELNHSSAAEGHR
jgi:serine/threonine protein kinase